MLQALKSLFAVLELTTLVSIWSAGLVGATLATVPFFAVPWWRLWKLYVAAG